MYDNRNESSRNKNINLNRYYSDGTDVNTEQELIAISS